MATDADRAMNDERTLLVMRHAKSSWSTGHTDRERPLNARGRRDAPRMGREIVSRGWVPGLVLCSPSQRTRETLQLVEGAIGRPLAVRFEDRLYLPELPEVIEELELLDDAERSVMLLGHNPSCEELILRLTGEEIPITTANVVRLSGTGTWASLVARPCQWRIVGMVRPRDLDDDATAP